MLGPIDNPMAGSAGNSKYIKTGPANILGSAYQVIPTDTWTAVAWPSILSNTLGWGIDGSGEKLVIPDRAAVKGTFSVSATVSWEDFESGTAILLGDHRRKMRIVLYYSDASASFFGENAYGEDEKHFVASCVSGETGKDAVQSQSVGASPKIDPTLTGATMWVEVFQNSGKDVRIKQQGSAGLLTAATPFLAAFQISR